MFDPSIIYVILNIGIYINGIILIILEYLLHVIVLLVITYILYIFLSAKLFDLINL